MDFFISNAFAQAGGQTGPSAFTSLLPLVIIFVIFYFLLIRPQSKRAKEQRRMVDGLAVGDEVVTNGGLIGKIIKAGDQYITVELAKDIEVRMQRHAVSTLLPKGTIKTLD